jgi:hypothetical protein
MECEQESARQSAGQQRAPRNIGGHDLPGHGVLLR